MPRPRKPTEILKLAGAFENHPNRRRPVGAKAGEPVGDPPAHLDEAEADVWREFCGNAPPGVLTSGDRISLEMLCLLVVRMRADFLPPPLWNALRGCLSDLGATPAARSKVAAPPGKPADADPLDGLAAMGRAARGAAAQAN